jgi:protein-S-isoprenylcysteine O-methyltransferase Ste14
LHPLPLTWPVGLAFWLAYAWAIAAELPFLRQRRGSPVSPADRGSMRAVLIAGAGGITLAFVIAWFWRAAAIEHAMVAYVLGIAFLLAGGRLRRHCFRMLGASFTFDVRAVHNQVVIESGAYRFVRHPSYTAGLLMGGGIGLALGNWLSLIVALVPAMCAYAYRISVEERALVATLGPAYSDYMSRTWRLIPYLL